MFDYMNGEPSPIMLSGEETGYRSEPNRPVFNPYAAQNFTGTIDFINPETHFTAVTATSSHHPFYHPQSQNPNNHFHNFSDSRAYTAPSSSYPNSHAPSSLTLVVDPTEFTFVPKSEFGTGFSNRIGLNLGGRTYFANSEDDFVNRLYGRSRIVEPGSVNSPRCQAEGCNADLTHVKHYHRRHKVCEFHSKAATVVTAGLTQRFCQQCSRFHVLSEFDNVKRSCRRRLADHNRRRRKLQQTHQVENNKSQLDDNAPIISSPQNLDGSPFGDSHSSSVTAAISPPRISLDSFGHRSSILREQLSSGHYNSHN